MTAALSCSGLTGGRGSITVFRDLELELAEGRVFALLGPNCAGKTTLLLTLAGLLPRQAGRVAVGGIELRSGQARAANQAGIVLVPDDRALFCTLTTEQNLEVARRSDSPPPREMLDVFPALEKRWSVPAGDLSGGEQQMLATARALIQRPKVMLIDEPSQGLAPLVVESLFETLRRVADELGTAVLLVEQHVELALEVADEAAVLQRGAIALHADAAAVRDRYDDLERAYLGDAVALAASDGAIDGKDPLAD
jgi:branched-chain amino acid transport system ATP-binding protein